MFDQFLKYSILTKNVYSVFIGCYLPISSRLFILLFKSAKYLLNFCVLSVFDKSELRPLTMIVNLSIFFL